MMSFVTRNLKLYFRDKASVFFSLLAVFIIFALYVLFLGDVWTSNLPKVDGVRALMDSWIMAGLLAVTSVTTVMGAFGTMVDDQTRKIIKDFAASPIGRGRIAGGYVLSSFVVGAIMSLLMLLLSELYIASRGGALLAPAVLLKVVGLVLLSALSNTAMVAFIVSFFKSQSAFGTASSILGTLVGFLTGIYLPIGMLPDAVQAFIKVFPVSHAALLIRQTMMADSMQKVFSGAPDILRQGFENEMGVVFRFGAQALPEYASYVILIGAAVVFYALSILRFSGKRK